MTYEELGDLLRSQMARGGEDRRKWIHAEGRNCDALFSALKDIQSGSVRISIDFEKPGRPGLRRLLQIADIAFISRNYAEFLAAKHLKANGNALKCESEKMMRGMLKEIGNELKDSAIGYTLVGSEGCYVFCKRELYTEVWEKVGGGFWQGEWLFFQLPARDLTGSVVETTGAGDTFIAGVIAGWAGWKHTLGVVDSGKLGNILAERKCCQKGFHDLWGGPPPELTTEIAICGG